jgi:histidine triad (HIT) family protein
MSPAVLSSEPSQPATDCEFCRIVRGEQKALIVCESIDCLAFSPIAPATRGHTLVIPRQHVRDLWQVSEGLEASLMRMVVRVGQALESVLRPEGMNLISSAGEAAEQTIFHLHLHVVPRWKSDRIGTIWPPKEPWNEAVKEDIADMVRAECARQG